MTWLYGPLHTVIKGGEKETSEVFAKKAPMTSTYGLMTNKPVKESRPSPSPLQKPLKSALKKVTMSDLLKRSASELQIHQTGSHANEGEGNNLSSSLSISKVNQQVGAFSPSVIANHRQPKLRFNQYVEQCVALTSQKKKNKENDDDNTTDYSYEPEDDDESDSGQEGSNTAIVVRSKPNKIRSSIRKIEPALLKTSSRSEQDSSDSETDFSRRIRPSFKRKSSTHWDAESAESDAFVQHIIEVSKNKPSNSRDPAASNTTVQWQVSDDDDDKESAPSKSDYDYEFDDDDWDAPTDHAPPIDDSPNTQWDESSSSSTTASNGSILNNLVRWASNHLWSSDNDDSK